jgi:hypothetical protein
MALPATVTVPDNVLWQRVGEEVVVVDVDKGDYHALDDVGGVMWRALEECPDVATALQRLRRDYDVDEGRLAHDLKVFVERLVGAGLLVTG